MQPQEFSLLEAMAREIADAPEIYRPSRFWEKFAGLNLQELTQVGLANFKRTIYQNYFNWIPHDFDDNQLRNVIAYWAKHPALGPIHAQIDGEAVITNAVTGFDPFAQAETRSLYGLYVGLLWHFASTHDPLGLLQRLEEPLVGNPINVRMDGRLISQDIANSVRELSSILEAYRFPKAQAGEWTKVVEIGAGYGRVAHVIGSAFRCRYIIVDITPALFVSQWYLSTLFPRANVFAFRHFDDFSEVTAEFEQVDFAFLTPNQLALLPDGYADLSIAISSLHEMRPDQVENFKQLLQAKTAAAIYFKQWKTFANTFDDVVMNKPIYDLSDDWLAVLDRTDPVQDMFFETVWLRREPI